MNLSIADETLVESFCRAIETEKTNSSGRQYGRQPVNFQVEVSRRHCDSKYACFESLISF